MDGRVHVSGIVGRPGLGQRYVLDVTGVGTGGLLQGRQVEVTQVVIAVFLQEGFVKVVVKSLRRQSDGSYGWKTIVLEDMAKVTKMKLSIFNDPPY